MKRRNRFRKCTGNGNGLGLWTLWFAKLSLIPSSLPFGNRKSAAESRFPQSLFFSDTFWSPCSACSIWWFLRLERSSTLAFTTCEFALWQVLAERCSFSPNHQERIPENCCLYLTMSYYDLQNIFDFIHLICNHHLSIFQFKESPPLYTPLNKKLYREFKENCGFSSACQVVSLAKSERAELNSSQLQLTMRTPSS